MPLLDAGLAFAVTMLTMATLVMKLVSILQNWLKYAPQIARDWLGNRATQFDQMLADFFDHELDKIKDSQGQRLFSDATVAALKDKAKEMAQGTHLARADLIASVLDGHLAQNVISQGLASSLANEVSARYAKIEKQYSELFRRQSQLFATLIALILALVFNVDSVTILNSYITNPAVRATVSNRADKALQDFQQALKEGKNGKPVDLAELEKQRRKFQEDLNQFGSEGFPFGWSYFPYAPYPPFKPAPDCSRRLQWLVGIALTALLAGLGTAFWYDVVRNLMMITRGDPTKKPEPDQYPLPIRLSTVLPSSVSGFSSSHLMATSTSSSSAFSGASNSAISSNVGSLPAGGGGVPPS